MDRSEILTLINVAYKRGDFGQQIPTETPRDVYCAVDSVSRDEFFAAGREGLLPAYKFTIFAPDYNGEKIVQYKDQRLGVYRTYLARNEMLELYTEEKAGI